MAALALAGCSGDPDPTAPPPFQGRPAPAQTGDGWATASPASVGLADEALLRMLAALEDAPGHGVHGLVVARAGKLVFEHYFPGEDIELDRQVPGSGQLVFTPRDFDRETPHLTASSAKSVISLLVGIALDQGLIAGLDGTLFSFFPDHAALGDPVKSQITLGDMITMRSGLPWDDGSYPIWDPRNDEYQLLFNPDPAAFVLAKPAVSVPGTVFDYNSGTNYLLGEIIERVSGESIDAFAERMLFAPLGITSYRWSVSNCEHDEVFSGGLYLRPRDMAKLGQLVLDGGTWQGQRIVSEAWLATSLQRAVDVPRGQTPLPSFVDGYGCQWWLGRFPSATEDACLAVGWGGQFIIVAPEFAMVVVVTGGGYLAPNFGQVLDLVDEYLRTAVDTAG